MNIMLLLPAYLMFSVYSLESMIKPDSSEHECDFDVQWGLSACQGNRQSMEDTHAILSPFDNERAFFAIYDGHGGKEAADAAAQVFHKYLSEELSTNKENSGKAILEKAFERTEKYIIDQKNNFCSGTTAVVALQEKSKLHLAWVGDSRAIIIRGNEVILATEDHKPGLPKEKERIIKAGSSVGVSVGGKVLRVFPSGLSVSRALGDWTLKLLDPALIATPDTMQFSLEDNDILLPACDGFWDVFSNESAARMVERLLQNDISTLAWQYRDRNKRGEVEKGDERIKLIARALRETALERGSTDNISVMVVQFKKRKVLKTIETDLQKLLLK